MTVTARNGCRMELYCDTAEKPGSVEVPMLHYKGYQVTDETGKRYQVMTGTNQVIQFDVSENFSGKIYIQFTEPWYWTMGTWISAVSFFAYAYSFFKRAPVKKQYM